MGLLVSKLPDALQGFRPSVGREAERQQRQQRASMSGHDDIKMNLPLYAAKQQMRAVIKQRLALLSSAAILDQSMCCLWWLTAAACKSMP